LLLVAQLRHGLGKSAVDVRQTRAGIQKKQTFLRSIDARGNQEEVTVPENRRESSCYGAVITLLGWRTLGLRRQADLVLFKIQLDQKTREEIGAHQPVHAGHVFLFHNMDDTSSCSEAH